MNANLSTLGAVLPEAVPQETLSRTFRGFPERMVVGLLAKMPLGGLCMEHADGRIHYFGAPGAKITARVRIHDDVEFYKRCAFYGNIGMGEAYTDGLWDTDDIAAVISWFIENMSALQGSDTASDKLPGVNLLKIVNWFRHFKRSNTVDNSRRNIAEHYDLGNEFYGLWLDRTMTYSCGIFSAPGEPLEAAQFAKYDALCKKLKLSPADHVLEIGCGWGGFSCHAATHYGCRITALTISEAQAVYARQRVKDAGLEDRVEIRIQDYRLVQGTFDKIASIEMIEAVGDKFHESFFAKCHEVLAPSGLIALQMITVPDCRYKSLTKGVDWIQRHIFPGSLLMSIGRVNDVLLKTGNLFLHDLQDMGAHYVQTLRHWHRNFNSHLEPVKALGFDEPFIRTWNYYLKYCEAGFATRNISVVQAVYTRPNNTLLQQQFEQPHIQ
ncbi:MAG: Cyclopropane-fatty-acyl-phospholipid synthase [Akkermansiaceae bacterium]|nr:Cyclopropane-fatty-acyl-phospholipid synthase [Akkermansiaceae bacterium]